MSEQCGHCRGFFDALEPCPFDPQDCHLCPTCHASAVEDYGPLGYPRDDPPPEWS